jgi:hypothetical protein
MSPGQAPSEEPFETGARRSYALKRRRAESGRRYERRSGETYRLTSVQKGFHRHQDLRKGAPAA